VRRARAHPGLLEDAEISVLANASAGAGGAVDLSVNAGGRAGGNDLTMSLSSREWTGDLTRSPLSARLNVRSEEAADLYGLIGLPGELKGFAGPANAELALDGVLGMGATARLTLTGEDARARFEGDVTLAGEEFSAKGTGRLQAADLMPWLMTAAVPLPGMDASLPAELTADLDYSGGLLVLSGLEGDLAETRLSGELNAELRDGLPHLTGELFAGALDLSLVSEMLFGLEAHMGEGAGWPGIPFRAGVNVPFTADLGLALNEAGFGNAARIENATLRARLARDGISVSGLSAAAFGGRLTGLGELRNDGGEGLFSAQFRLEDGDVGLILPQTGIRGSAGLTASLSSTGKSFEAMFSALAGSGTASLSDLVLPGAAPDALEDILAEADRIGREIGEEEAAAFAPGIVRAGRFAAGEVEFAFSVAGGVLRAPPIQMAAPGAGMTAELSFDFGRLHAEAEATVNYDAGAEALVGSEPSVRLVARGPLDALSVTTDTEPLARFLTQRALEREQQRVEDMQAGLLEQQRLRREVRYFAALRQERLDREEARRLAEEQERRMIEDEMRRRAELEEQRRLEEERRRAQEEERRLAEEEERRRAQEEAEIRLQQERQRVEEARRRAEEEARAEEERRLRLEDEIQNILRLEALPQDDPDAVLRTPLEPPPAAGAEAPATETEAPTDEPSAAIARPPQPSADEEAVSDSFPPGVWGSMFRPENLSPEGFARRDRSQ
jgi:flagellar biosynthesis GTPase FlhF